MIDESDLKQWQKLQATLKQVRVKEMRLRKMIAEAVVKMLGVPFESGTCHQMIGQSQATVSVSLSYNLDKGMLLAIQTNLSEEEKDCIEWKPALDVKKYKKLKEQRGETMFPLMQAITIKPSTPTLNVDILEEL